ncbi:MAG TPA: glycine betaine ABC transporter substrate-binding protein [Paenalcaligenes sp.]|nr:glycine betaine ABC transporter substrate-binding protein [Paenalcaligenes sp.]
MLKNFNIRHLFKVITSFLLGALICAPIAAQAATKLRIGTNSWPENIAAANMWKILLEERGYEVELKEMSLEMVYSGVASNALDIALEMWLPTTGKAFYERHKDNVVLQEPWFHNTSIGLVVPEYVEIDSIEELVEKNDLFNYRGQPTIFGIEAGAAIMGITEQVIDEYQLDMQLLESSDAAMMASLDDAYQRQEPIVATLWSPHWAFSRYEIKYLDDPKGIYGETEEIFWLSTLDLPEDEPELVRWMNQWDMNDEQLGSLIAAINEADTAPKGAQQWIDENQELVDSWFD